MDQGYICGTTLENSRGWWFTTWFAFFKFWWLVVPVVFGGFRIFLVVWGVPWFLKNFYSKNLKIFGGELSQILRLMWFVVFPKSQNVARGFKISMWCGCGVV